MKNETTVRRMDRLILKHNKQNYVLSIVFSIITAVFEILMAFVLMILVDSIDKGIDTIFKILLYTLIGAIIYILVGIINVFMNAKYNKQAVCNLRNLLMKAIIYKPLKDTSNDTIGAYIAILNNDLLSVETNYIATSVPVIKDICMVSIAIVAMIYLEWRLTIGVLVMLLLPLLVSWAFGSKLEKSQSKITESTHNLNALIKDIFSGMSVVKSFNIEKEVTNILSHKSEQTEENKRKFAYTSGIQVQLMTICSLLVIVVIFSLGTYLTIKGATTLGGVLAFVQLLNNLTVPISSLFTSIAKRKSCSSIFERFEKILKQPATNEKSCNIEQLNDGITINNLSYSIDEKTELLHNISFKFQKGKSYAIVGLSGSGKSTLLSLLAGYYFNYTGSIKYDQTEVRDISEKSLYQLISIVQQESFIFDDTLEQNVKLFKEWSESEIKEATEGACLQQLIELRGYDLKCGENGRELSGGEKQRISIARALLKKSKVLLLDEATSALDVSTSTKIEDNLSNLKETIRIVITHKLDESLLRTYDEIVMLQEGRIVESGLYDDLMNKKGYFYALKQITSQNQS